MEGKPHPPPQIVSPRLLVREHFLLSSCPTHLVSPPPPHSTHLCLLLPPQRNLLP